MPKLFNTCPKDELKNISRLYFDVDGTITQSEQFRAPMLSSLYHAAAEDLSLVAVTGRSAAWGEMMLRVFPIDAVIVETGAMCLYRDMSAAKSASHKFPVKTLHFEKNSDIREQNFIKRQIFLKDLQKEFPTMRIALDNIGRIYDSAIDLNEDGTQLSQDIINKIILKLDEAGFSYAQSNVHINFWQGEFNKASMVQRYLKEIEESTDIEQSYKQMLYIGDSRNDGPMFVKAGVSVGVANVKNALDVLKSLGQAPEYILYNEGGRGFVEMVNLLLSVKENN